MVGNSPVTATGQTATPIELELDHAPVGIRIGLFDGPTQGSRGIDGIVRVGHNKGGLRLHEHNRKGRKNRHHANQTTYVHIALLEDTVSMIANDRGASLITPRENTSEVVRFHRLEADFPHVTDSDRWSPGRKIDQA
jgi:hypothetical protein